VPVGGQARARTRKARGRRRALAGLGGPLRAEASAHPLLEDEAPGGAAGPQAQHRPRRRARWRRAAVLPVRRGAADPAGGGVVSLRALRQRHACAGLAAAGGVRAGEGRRGGRRRGRGRSQRRGAAAAAGPSAAAGERVAGRHGERRVERAAARPVPQGAERRGEAEGRALLPPEQPLRQ
ncbi:unnamed protein product, partial [Prorocentrum cordatum]